MILLDAKTEFFCTKYQSHCVKKKQEKNNSQLINVQ